jgi:hypothetical protein
MTIHFTIMLARASIYHEPREFSHAEKQSGTRWKPEHFSLTAIKLAEPLNWKGS